jgi:hypothetical protein
MSTVSFFLSKNKKIKTSSSSSRFLTHRLTKRALASLNSPSDSRARAPPPRRPRPRTPRARLRHTPCQCRRRATAITTTTTNRHHHRRHHLTLYHPSRARFLRKGQRRRLTQQRRVLAGRRNRGRRHDRPLRRLAYRMEREHAGWRSSTSGACKAGGAGGGRSRGEIFVPEQVPERGVRVIRPGQRRARLVVVQVVVEVIIIVDVLVNDRLVLVVMQLAVGLRRRRGNRIGQVVL